MAVLGVMGALCIFGSIGILLVWHKRHFLERILVRKSNDVTESANSPSDDGRNNTLTVFYNPLLDNQPSATAEDLEGRWRDHPL
eukprot:gene4912-5995_t